MNADRRRDLVKIDGLDGERWHILKGTSTEPAYRDSTKTVYHTLCGEHVREHEVEGRSEPGKTPRDLSGTTVCYDCVAVERDGQDTYECTGCGWRQHVGDGGGQFVATCPECGESYSMQKVEDGGESCE